MDTYNQVLNFWFKTLGSPKDWFMSKTKHDNIIKEKFGDLWKKACDGKLNHWMENKDSCLALIIILDQFSRHIGRGKKSAYNQDFFAIQTVKKKLFIGKDSYIHLYHGWEKVFFLMPLQHSENIEDQQIIKECYKQLIKKSIGEEKNILSSVYKHTIGHYHVIIEHGRFPMRNKILGRENTKLEELYLINRNSHY